MTKDNYVATQNSESALKGKETLSRQTQHKVEVNSVMTKTSIVMTKVKNNYKKNVAMQQIMSRHNEELKEEISVATMIEKFLNYNVAILLALLQQ